MSAVVLLSSLEGMPEQLFLDENLGLCFLRMGHPVMATAPVPQIPGQGITLLVTLDSATCLKAAYCALYSPDLSGRSRFST